MAAKAGANTCGELFAGGCFDFGLVASTYLVTAKTIGWMNRRGTRTGFRLRDIAGLDMPGIAQSA